MHKTFSESLKVVGLSDNGAVCGTVLKLVLGFQFGSSDEGHATCDKMVVSKGYLIPVHPGDSSGILQAINASRWMIDQIH